jgi:rhodanese-related sulfurtransferase
MSTIKRVSPEEAATLLEEGYVYLDVRTEAEFESGHVPGALNVPLLLAGAGGRTPNPDFMSVVESAFEKDARIVVGCQTGGRSLRAATQMIQAGFDRVVDLRTGWAGCRDAFGRTEAGWGAKGLPVETGQPAGRRYEDIKGGGTTAGDS